MEHIVGARSPNFDLLADDAGAYRRTCLVSQINTCACRSADTGRVWCPLSACDTPVSACGAGVRPVSPHRRR